MTLRAALAPGFVLALTLAAAAAVPAQEAAEQGEALPDIGHVAQTLSGTGAVLRGLDKSAGSVIDLEVAVGGSALAWGRMTVSLADCRFPADNPAAEAFARLAISDALVPGPPVFSGWMIASSPALNALDHSRYDIWLLRCTTAEADGTTP